MNERRDRLNKMMAAGPAASEPNALKPRQEGITVSAVRRRALLFAPPPVPSSAFMSLLESEGFDVLLAHNLPTAETLLRSATPQFILAIAPTVAPDVLQRWKELAPEAQVRVIPGLVPLAEERIAPPKEVADFMIRALSIASEMVSEDQGVPRSRVGQILQLTEKAAKALRFNPQELVSAELSVVLSSLVEAIRHDKSSDQDATATLKKGWPEHWKLLSDFAEAMRCPFRVGAEPPSAPPDSRAPVPEELVDAATRYVLLLEKKDPNPTLTLRRMALEEKEGALKLHPAAVEAVLAASGPEEGKARADILLVDGDSGSRNLLALRLVNEGYTVRTAGDGRSALEEIRRQAPSLVLAETVLAGLDGYALLDAAKREGKGKIPFVFLSSKADPLSINKGLLLGAADFLSKPINFEVLLTKIEKVLAQSGERSDVSARLSLSDLTQASSPDFPLVNYQDLRPGTVILGRFHIEANLGEGGMGMIFKARDERLEEHVVLKVMKPDFSEDVLRRFKREIRLARRITHPGVVRIYDFWEAGPIKFVTMEFLEGTDLRDHMKKRKICPVPVALRITYEMMEALAAAHEVGVVHRDIKPQNVIMLSSGKVKVLDFGIAQGLEPESKDTVTVGGLLVGTPEYMSPEQLLGEKLDPRTDLYSTGVMLYELLAGEPPFPSNDRMAGAQMRLVSDPLPLSAVNPKIPKNVEAVILRLLQRNRNDRYPSASAVIADLNAIREQV